MFFEETGPATKHQRDVIWHAVWKLRHGLLREAFRSEGDYFPLFLLANKALPPHSGKLPAVTCVLIFQIACEMTSLLCVVAGPVSSKKQLYTIHELKNAIQHQFPTPICTPTVISKWRSDTCPTVRSHFFPSRSEVCLENTRRQCGSIHSEHFQLILHTESFAD